MKSDNIVNDFLNPSSCYRGKPFWAWNDKLNEEELRRQIRVFHEMGFGGFFMHARVGLKTEYLGQEWFELVKVCIDEAKKHRMEVWLYDEDRWPSGAAGGFVTKNQKYQQRELIISRRQKTGNFKWEDCSSTSFIFAVKFGKERVSWYKKLNTNEDMQTLDKEVEIIEFDVKRHECTSWYNGATYLDTLNSEAVSEFIQITHEAYRRNIGEEFGTTVPGIFTDEPNYGLIFRKWWDEHYYSLPWTEKLPQNFFELFGYDIVQKIPILFFPTAESSSIENRYHYHRCLTRMFVEAFAKQISRWCETNGIKLTGHVLEESPISSNCSVVGSAMQFYAYMQVPGVDMLTKYNPEYVAVKQCSSVARQTGRKWVMSELYGCTGWDTSFEDYKHIGDWQAVLGITFRCPHLSWYSMAGEAKRDCPASINFQTPWWREYKYVEDYFSRLNVLLTDGEPVCDLLVINPAESYSLLFEQNWQDNEQIKSMDQDYRKMVDWLLGGHLDFDFADEHLLVEFDSKIGQDENGAYFQVGQMKYHAVLVPPMLSIRRTTFNLLRSFSREGGIVIFTSEPPKLIEARVTDEVKMFAKNITIPFSRDDILRTLKNKIGRINITDDFMEVSNIFCQLRRIGADTLIFMVNTDREHCHKSINVQVESDYSNGQQIQLWDPTNGKRFELIGSLASESVQFAVDMPASGSRLVIISNESSELPVYAFDETTLGEKMELDWSNGRFSLDDHNVLVLDRADCDVWLEGKEKVQILDEEILQIDRALRECLEIPFRSNQMVQPWANKCQPIGPVADVKLTYSFNVEVIPISFLMMAIEQLSRWRIELNGCLLDSSSSIGWWVDPAIQTLQIDKSALKVGKNTLTLQIRFDQTLNLEVVYMLGEFGVRVDGNVNTINEFPRQLSLGSWVEQGLPFYSGNVVYHTAFNIELDSKCRYMLQIPKFKATALEISVNNTENLIVGWPNYSVDITRFLCEGWNEIDIKLLGSRRNSFGPLHLAEDKPNSIWPDSFMRHLDNWQDDYKLVDYGLFGLPNILKYDHR